MTFPWGRWKTLPLISHSPPVKADSNVSLLQIQTTREPHLRNHPDFLIWEDSPQMWAAPSASSPHPKGLVEGRLFTFCSIGLSSPCKLICPITTVDFSPALRTRISGIPLWTEDQQLSRKLPGFQGLTETLRYPATCSEELLG